MIIEKINENFVKIFSLGYEKNYSGNFIEYYDNTITFVFFYFKKYCRVYIINGIQNKDIVPTIQSKVNVICKYENHQCKRFRLFLKEIVDDNNLIYFFPPLFFLQLSVFLEKKKNYRFYVNLLYEKYKKEINYGLCNFNERN